jgi:cyclopropane-fatty-acyl-phospholipid synthase
MFFLLHRPLAAVVTRGSLTVIDAAGAAHEFGDGVGDAVCVRIADRSLYWKLAVHPDLYIGEAYMNGTLVMERGSIYELFDLILSQIDYGRKDGWTLVDRLRTVARRLGRMNPVDRSRRNVAHHYDLSGELYDLFLDRDRQYSCAYFEHPDQSLDDAQLAKKRHIAAKLALRPGMRVLDIGSGWGGLAIYLAEVYDVSVVGVTLSEEQHRLSRQRVASRGLEHRVDIRLLDYRLLDETFDRIVSVGMFEHVGLHHLPEFFQRLRDLLEDDGVALLHSIGRSGEPAATSAWIRKYIFPGGYIPALSEVQPAIEQSGLYLCDVELLRLHYARTLREWRRRFVNHWDKAKDIYDERFCRMWEFYLATSEISFRHHGLNNFQVQLTKRQGTLPITRDYMLAEESRLRGVDQEIRRPKVLPG